MSTDDESLERAQLATNRRLGEARADLVELAAQTRALIELAIEKGLVFTSEVAARIDAARARLAADGDSPAAKVTVAATSAAPAAEVDCDARIPLCRTVCCSMEVPLTVGEVEAAAVRWDLARPYFLRRDDDRRCVHLDRPTGRCGVYAGRPQTCRNYSCAGDRRVWLDFERRVPNEKGIAALFAHRAERPLTLVQIRPTLRRPLDET